MNLPHHPLNRKEILYKDLSYKIVGLAIDVHRKLGSGFLEKVYENALIELQFYDAWLFENGLSEVELYGKKGYVNTKGRIIW